MANLILVNELKAAKKLAGRKKGVTRAELADHLAIDYRRAAIVLARVRGLKKKPIGAGHGKGNRALVYCAK